MIFKAYISETVSSIQTENENALVSKCPNPQTFKSGIMTIIKKKKTIKAELRIFYKLLKGNNFHLFFILAHKLRYKIVWKVILCFWRQNLTFVMFEQILTDMSRK